MHVQVVFRASGAPEAFVVDRSKNGDVIINMNRSQAKHKHLYTMSVATAHGLPHWQVRLIHALLLLI